MVRLWFLRSVFAGITLSVACAQCWLQADPVDIHMEVYDAELSYLVTGPFVRFSGTLIARYSETRDGNSFTSLREVDLVGKEDPSLYLNGVGVQGAVYFDGRFWRTWLGFTINHPELGRGGVVREVSWVDPTFPTAHFYSCNHIFSPCLEYHMRPAAEEDFRLFFQRGDVNDDGDVDIVDLVRTIRYIFALDAIVPRCAKAADVNDDGEVGIADALDQVQYFFLGRATIAVPAGFCGVDVTEDDLECRGSQVCESKF